MFDITTASPVGYVLLDPDGYVITANDAFLRIAKFEHGDYLRGKRFAYIFKSSDSFAELHRLVKTGAYVRGRAVPATFVHWPEWEERYYDLHAQRLGQGADAPVLMRFQETIALPPEEIDRATSLLRVRARGRFMPLFSGEDMSGRVVDAYVHPQSGLLPDRVSIVMVYRDTNDSLTFEFDEALFQRLAIVHLLRVNS